MALHSCPYAMLYYRVVITREVITGIYLHTYYMIHVVTKVGPTRRVPASDPDVGGSKDRWLHPGRGGPGFPKAPDCYFVAERQGRLRPPRREVGLALDGVRGYFIITRLTRSWDLI